MRVRRWMARHRQLVMSVMVLLCTALFASTTALIVVQAVVREKDKALQEKSELLVISRGLSTVANEEKRKVEATNEKLNAETAKLNAETAKLNEESAKVKAENESYCELFTTASDLLVEGLFTQQAILGPKDIRVLDSMFAHYQKYSASKQVNFETRAKYSQIAWSIARIYRRLGHLQKAEQSLLIAKEHVDKLLKEDPQAPCCRLILGQILDEHGCLLAAQRRWQEAESAHLKAVKHWYGLVEDHGESDSDKKILAMYKQNYAEALENHGLALDELKQHKEAEDRFEEAGTIRQELAKEKKDDYSQHKLGSHYVSLGRLYANRGMFVEALEQARKAQPIFIKLVQRVPDSREMWYGLAVCHSEMGRYLAQLENWADADRALQDAMVAQELLYKKYPSDADYALHLGTIYCNLAVLRGQAGSFQDALHMTTVAERVLKPLKERDAWSGLSQALMRDVFAERVKARMALKEFQRAVEDAETTIALSEPNKQAESKALLSQVLARAGKWQQALAKAEEVRNLPNLDSRAAYGLACTYARLAQPVPEFIPVRQQMIEQALHLLQHAEKQKLFASPFMRMQLNAGEDFTVLRNLPEFQKLCKRVFGPGWVVKRKSGKSLENRSTSQERRF